MFQLSCLRLYSLNSLFLAFVSLVKTRMFTPKGQNTIYNFQFLFLVISLPTSYVEFITWQVLEFQ